MNPEKERLDGSPRSLSNDAFFSADRSSTPVSRSAKLIALDANGNDSTRAPATTVSFSGFQNKHAVTRLTAANPLPHARMKDPPPSKPGEPKKKGEIDASVAGWKHEVTYTCFFSKAARALTGTAMNQPRLQVKLLFGTGTEYYRHGVCGAVEDSLQPTLLIDIKGIEPSYTIEFWNPANPTERKTLKANNRWGVGITTEWIERAIAGRYGRVISYDVSICAAFSTGYLGLHGSIMKGLFPLGGLERVIIFDCLYGTLKAAIDKVRASKAGVHIIAYVVTQGGNSFQDEQPASFATLSLGRIPGWNYINLMGDTGFHAVTSARIVSEGKSTSILDSLPADFDKALADLTALAPPRNRVVSHEALYRKVKGGLPSDAVTLAAFAAKPPNAAAIRAFARHVATTRHCIGRAQLLGWKAPPGEEWHDMLLVEFGWEYLS